MDKTKLIADINDLLEQGYSLAQMERKERDQAYDNYLTASKEFDETLEILAEFEMIRDILTDSEQMINQVKSHAWNRVVEIANRDIESEEEQEDVEQGDSEPTVPETPIGKFNPPPAS